MRSNPAHLPDRHTRRKRENVSHQESTNYRYAPRPSIEENAARGRHNAGKSYPLPSSRRARIQPTNRRAEPIPAVASATPYGEPQAGGNSHPSAADTQRATSLATQQPRRRRKQPLSSASWETTTTNRGKSCSTSIERQLPSN